MEEKRINEIKNIKSIRELFEKWQNEQETEIDRIEEKIKSFKGVGKSRKEIFEKEVHKKRKNNDSTISSHFSQFFNEEDWTCILKNAFNMDGCVGRFEPDNGGYSYIFLLKEANDSAKKSKDNYANIIYADEEVNTFVQDWIKGEGRMSPLLNKLCRAIGQDPKKPENRKKFVSEYAYMNINKRGGEEKTQGFNRTAVLNYAKAYNIFILQQIFLLGGKNAEVTIFVGWKENDCFWKLMDNLTENIVEEKEKKGKFVCSFKYQGKELTFVNIPHPSGRISAEKLTEEMQKVKVISCRKY